ncbi:MAG: hypothetical protein NZ908_01405 [Candidatus Micrarchaeota archaeon]|nr:hypothetical protein [Candidatus Micrarchaeota archaeon]MCX8154717.1 hypothetical protein [Candidatus Micrarchaeota archaeon]
MLIRLEFQGDSEHIYHLLYPIYEKGGFRMERYQERLVIEIDAKDSVEARQIINSILRLTSAAESIQDLLNKA